MTVEKKRVRASFAVDADLFTFDSRIRVLAVYAKADAHAATIEAATLVAARPEDAAPTPDRWDADPITSFDYCKALSMHLLCCNPRLGHTAT